jgi:uncharacterized protein YggE
MKGLEVDEDVRSVDGRLADAAAPEAAALARVRDRVVRSVDDRPTARPGVGLTIPRSWYAAAAAAVILLIGAGALGAAAVNRLSGPGQATGSTVLAPQQATSQAQGSQAASDTAVPIPMGPGASFAPIAQGPAAASPAFFGGSCSSAPAVQFQGRGLAATGIAPITGGASDAVTDLWIGVQENGSDVASVVAAAHADITAIVAALEKAGLPSSAIHQQYFNTYGSAQAKQFSAYGSVQAEASGADQLAAASSAALQVHGVSSYSTSTGVGGQPTSQQVQAAVGTAAAQARQIANATARAAGVTLGAVDSVVTQPPSVCYGSSGPSRVVQVTITYAIK